MILRSIVVIFIISVLIGFLVLQRTSIIHQVDGSQDIKPAVIYEQKISYPHPQKNYKEAPEISAHSAVVMDAKSGVSLFEKNPHLKHLPASTTKMMTALVALENCNPDDVITVNRLEASGTQMGLVQGDKLTAQNLLYGLLLSSGNDAAYALADGCGTSYEDFIEHMNNKAKELDMQNTHFVNPAGFDADLQYSTAQDLSKLAKIIVANPLVAKIVATKSTVVTDITGNRTYYLENVNKLLGSVNGVEGVKSGQTEGALEILVTKTTRNNNTVIVSILGSQDRFKESKELIEWAFANYKWE